MTLMDLLTDYEHATEKQQREFPEKLRLAAEKGDPVSGFAYGYLLHLRNPPWTGEFQDGIQWMRRACRSCDPEMLLLLADALRAAPGITETKLREIYSLHYRGRNSGNARLQNRLGILCLSGIGCRQNIKKGCSWIEKAAKQGYPPAVENMAELENMIFNASILKKLNCGLIGLYTEKIHDLLSPEELEGEILQFLEGEN